MINHSLQPNLRHGRWRYFVYRVFKKKVFRYYCYPVYDLLLALLRSCGLDPYLKRYISGKPWRRLIHASVKKKVLILRPDHIGDFIYSLPSLLLLKRALADEYSIDILIDPCNQNLCGELGIFDQVHVFPIFNQCGNRCLPSQYEYEAISQAIGPVDHVIDLRPDSDNYYLLDWLLGQYVFRIHNRRSTISQVLQASQTQSALLNTHDRSNQYWYYDDAFTGWRPQLIWNFCQSICKQLNVTVMCSFSEAIQASQTLLAQHFTDNVGARNYVVFCPETRNASKTWPVQESHALVKGLLEENIPIVLVGESLEPCFEDHPLITDLRSKASLLNAFQLVANSQLYIGFDSGLAHFAGLIGTTSIAIFTTKTDPDVWQAIASNANQHVLRPLNPRPKTWWERLVSSKHILAYERTVQAVDVLQLIRKELFKSKTEDAADSKKCFSRINELGLSHFARTDSLNTINLPKHSTALRQKDSCLPS